VIDKKTNELVVKLVNVSGKTQAKDIQVSGVKKLDAEAKLTILTAGELTDVNSFNQPDKVAPSEQTLKLKGKIISLSLTPHSFTVVRVKML
jgi:alpha-L-arabinofuranosidase